MKPTNNPLESAKRDSLIREAQSRLFQSKGLDLNQLEQDFESLTGGDSLIKSHTDIWLDKFIGQCDAIIKIKQLTRKLAARDIEIPVLIIGESGTGKELIANALHGDRPGEFVAVNCAGIPDTLLEAEFFGAVKGAYTGCDRDRQGYLEEAHNGTLFLDEIGDMPLLLQSKLLRCLQEKKARRVGSPKEYKFNVRIVSATNRTFEELRTNKNIFRSDLLYRLAGKTIEIPALRARGKEECKLIVETLGYQWKDTIWPWSDWMKTVIEKGGTGAFTSKELDEIYLEKQIWEECPPYPGNVRELLNKLESEKIFGD